MAVATKPEADVLEACRGPGGYGWFLKNVLGCRLYPKQEETAEAVRTQERVSIVGANGCVAPETRITNADTNEQVAIGDIKGTFPVWALDGLEVVRAVAQEPFIKRVADMYRVAIDNGRSFVGTLDHRLLTPNGWRYLRELAVGDAVAIEQAPIRSSSFESQHLK